MKRFIALTLLSLLLSSQMVFAQATLPEFTVRPIDELDLNTSSGDDLSTIDRIISIPNSKMRDKLLLQNDITMLSALKAWQEQVSSLEETYTRAGLSFDKPKPPRNICEQVPSNTLCREAYPEFAPIPEVTEIASPINDVPSNTPFVAPTPTPVKQIRAKSYEWDSISCISQNCRAVLIDKNQNLRFSVEEGERLEDGVTITAISPTGVHVREDGETHRLRSAMPTAAGGAQEGLPQNDVSVMDQLSTLPVSALEGIEPVEPIVLDAGEPEPVMGSTGLF